QTTSTKAMTPALATGGRPPRHRPSLATRIDQRLSAYIYVAPFFAIFIAFGLFPLIYTGWVSLHEVTLQNPDDMAWVGLDNYSRLVHDHLFWNAVWNT